MFVAQFPLIPPGFENPLEFELQLVLTFRVLLKQDTLCEKLDIRMIA